MKTLLLCLCQLFVVINAIEKLPSYIYIPLEKSFVLECQKDQDVFWKIYRTNGKIEIVKNQSVHLKEFEKNRDGFYQCLTNDRSKIFEKIFIFSNAARAIVRNWTVLTNFHNDLLTICHAEYIHFGFNEQFIELIDSEQIVRYNRSFLLVKHIRSSTHLFCKLYIDTISVGIRVQTLLSKNFPSPLLSDKYLKKNDYLQMHTYERDIYQIAFEDDSIYFHCPSSKQNLSIQWHFLSYNYYLTKILSIIHHTDTKISSLKITDAGMYTCQTENTIHKRIILTIIHPPKSPDNIYEHTRQVNFNSKYLICCNLDAIPYPTYSWTMTTDNQTIPSIWCTKRCCWLHVIHKIYENLICTSANQLGKAKYHIHLVVHETHSKGEIVYDDTKLHTIDHFPNPIISKSKKPNNNHRQDQMSVEFLSALHDLEEEFLDEELDEERDMLIE